MTLRILRTILLLLCFYLQFYEIVTQKCDISKKDVDYSGDKVLFFGDRNAIIPQNQKDIDNYCRTVGKHVNVGLQFARCLKPFPKTAIGLGFRGFKRFTKKRCLDKNWRESFVKLGNCMTSQNITENLHKCTDYGSLAFDYVYERVPLKDQVLLGCCVYGSIMSLCFAEEAAVCGEELSRFAYLLQNEPTQDAFNLLCSSLNTPEKCAKRYGKYLTDIRKYLKTPRKLKSNVMTAAMRMMLGDEILDVPV